jgi:hypothetical protein
MVVEEVKNEKRARVASIVIVSFSRRRWVQL